MSSIGFHTQIIISQSDVLALHLSVPGWSDFSRPPVSRGIVRHDVPHAVSFVPAALKLSYPEHVARLACQTHDSPERESRTMLAWGTRNTFQNLGLPGWDRNQSPRLLCRIDEPWRDWIYSGIGMDSSGRFSLFRVQFAENANGEAIPILVDSEVCELSWFITGQPIVWDGEVPPLPTLAAMTYDLRHIWKLRWEDWQQCPADRKAHDELMASFLEHLQSNLEDRAEALAAIADRCQLQITDSYLHSSLGMTCKGDLILLMKTGSLSDRQDSAGSGGPPCHPAR